MKLKPKVWKVAFTATDILTLNHSTDEITTTALLIKNNTDDKIYIAGASDGVFEYDIASGAEFSIQGIDSDIHGKDSNLDLSKIFAKADGAGDVVMLAMVKGE